MRVLKRRYCPRCLSKKRAISSNASLVSGAAASREYCACDCAFIHLQHRFHTGLAQLAMHAHRIAQQQIARPVVRIAGGKPCMSP